MQKYHGLLIKNHCTKDAVSKKTATETLKGWKPVYLSAHDWIACLERGQTIQPSTFEEKADGTWTHSKSLFKETFFVCADADNIKGVEFLQDGTDKNPYGIDAFTEADGLSKQYPQLRKKAFAVGQSVSSMSDAKPPHHRRYRLIFLFDKPIKSPQHYYAILNALSSEFPIIPRKKKTDNADKRSPTQPVFGNAREGFNRFVVLDNVLSLDEFPQPDPSRWKKKPTPEKLNESEQQKITDFVQSMGIIWNAEGKSQYFEKRFCPQRIRQHTNLDAKSVQFFLNLDGSVNGFCNGCNDFWYLVEPKRKRRAAQRLHVVPTIPDVGEAMDTIRNLLQGDILDWLLKVYESESKELLIINTGTGTGKSTACILTFENVLMLTPTRELAAEQYDTALSVGKFAFLHKTRWHNYNSQKHLAPNDIKIGLDSDDAAACVYPALCDAIFKKGHSARALWCDRLCEYSRECYQRGFLSQYKRYQDSQDRLQVFTALPQNMATDARLAEVLHAFGVKRDGAVLVIDEADPIRQIPTRFINLENWRTAKKDYNLTGVDKFFGALLEHTADAQNGLEFAQGIQKGFNAFADYLLTLDPPLDLNTGLEFVQKWLNLKPDVLERESKINWKKQETLSQLRQNQQHLIADLQALMKSLENTQTPAVMRVDADLWRIATPMTLNASRTVFLTASDTADLLCDMFKSVCNITRTEPIQAEWKEGCKIFQVSTGRYTTASLTDTGKNTLTRTGRSLIQGIVGLCKDEKKTLVVAPLAFCPHGTAADDPLLCQLHALENVHITTHAKAIGVNTYNDFERVIIFLFEPPVNVVHFIASAIYNHQTLDFNRDSVTFESHGVRLDDVQRYRDKQVQRVFDVLCANVMMQSYNRIRPQMDGGKEIWLLTCEPIPAPIQPILFKIPDLLAWCNTDRTDPFDTFLQTRENRDTKTIASEDNVSESTARRRNKSKRDADIKARDAEIIRLNEDEHFSERKIMRTLGLSRGIVQSVLKKRKSERKN